MINIKELKKHEPLYVIGHKNPDIDTAVSSSLLASILTYFGIEAYPSILDKNYDFDPYNKKMMDDCIVYKPKVIKTQEASKYNFVIVDHNNPIQSVGEDATIVFGMDHHKNSNKINNILISTLCCNSLFIYDYFKDSYPFSKEELYQIYMATLNDSAFFRASRYTSADKKILDTMGIHIDTEELFHKYFELTDLSNGMDNIIHKYNKIYEYNGVRFNTSLIKSNNKNQYLLEEYKKCLQKEDESILGVWQNFESKETFAFFWYKHKLQSWYYPYIASRSKDVMNDVVNYLESNN